MSPGNTIWPTHSGEFMTFSTCSKSYINAFFASGRGKCLDDAPRLPIGVQSAEMASSPSLLRSATTARRVQRIATAATRKTDACSSQISSARMENAATCRRENLGLRRSSAGRKHRRAMPMIFALARRMCARIFLQTRANRAQMGILESAFEGRACLLKRSAQL